jgi:hypothetical protein
VRCRRIDPEILRSGKGLDQALAESSSEEIDQEVFDKRASRRREKEINERIKRRRRG